MISTGRYSSHSSRYPETRKCVRAFPSTSEGETVQIPKIEAVTAVLRKQEAQAYRLISEAGQDGILLSDLSIAIFGSRLGNEPSKINGTCVCVCRLRKSLATSGMSISFAQTSQRYRVEVAV